MHSLSARAGLAAAAALAAVLAAAGCSSSSSSSSSAAATVAPTPSASSPASSTSPPLSVSELTSSFSAMSQLEPLAAAGKGNITVVLPDNAPSSRYVQSDAPYLKQAFSDAGLKPADYTVDNALGTDASELSLAESAIAKGAKVLVLDPLDSAVGTRIESYATAHGVTVIDYDQLTQGGSRAYYVSFNSVKAGQVMAQGLASCIAAWGVKDPDVLVMGDASAGGNAAMVAQGYNGALAPYFSSGKWKNANPAGASTPSAALSEFEQQYTADKGINAALIPSDENGASIIQYLRSQGVKPRTFPTTGQDATLAGLQNILAGYQCGTVYEPSYEEAQAAVGLALYVRAGKTPPSSLVNGTVEDTSSHAAVPSVQLTPEWVTTANMNSTVIADRLVPASQLCAGAYASACTAAGIAG